jgi:SAM-dependent methyltransferase
VSVVSPDEGAFSIAPLIEHHYADTDETGRLGKPRGTVEFLRTMAILGRFLPPPPARVLDVGGGPGRYALELQQAGYVVDLIDPLEAHVSQARAAGVRATSVGDARKLEIANDSVDVVLLLGPLYHCWSGHLAVRLID